MITKYDFDERVAICMESGIDQKTAEEVAARQFFKSCNLPTQDYLQEAERVGWGKLKAFRTMNQNGLDDWSES